MDRITAYAPGSASNLGPGFDCLGIAFTGKGDRVTARPSRARPACAWCRSRTRGFPLDPARNTAAIAAAAVLRRAALRRPSACELTIQKGLPLAGGMGGQRGLGRGGCRGRRRAPRRSTSAREDLLEAALEAEAVVAGRHADNVAPSLLGGAVLVLGLDPPRLGPVRVHPGLALVLVSPAYQVETAAARAVLPAGRSAGATRWSRRRAWPGSSSGLERGDADLIRGSMVDRIAEPVRAGALSRLPAGAGRRPSRPAPSEWR